MQQRVDQVTVVGGGSAGWIMALYLTTMLNRSEPGRVKVTVIESPRIPQIGVGEGTVTGFSQLLRQLDIPEKDFMLKSDASFKCAGRFVGWQLDASGQALSQMNPFMDGGHLDGFETFHYYLKYGGDGRDYIGITQPTVDMVLAGESPKHLDAKPYDGVIPYTYHLNAAAFSEQLAAIAKQRGVAYIQDEMLDVELAEDGSVAALQLEQAGRYPVQFVVDCTGFSGRILQQAMGEPFLDYSKHLLVDRAIPMPVPHEDPTDIKPCTTAQAMNAGWVFNVPLFSRMGTGYIYSSAFKTDQQATDELLQYLGDRAPKDVDPRVIPMKIGRVRNTWVKNCVAAGLSAGFVEPLEATAIYTIERTARHLVADFPFGGIEPVVVNKFNSVMDRQYRESLDFIIMMYATANRPEPFWQAARNDVELTDTLQENLALWRHQPPGPYDVSNQFLFSYWNYFFMLLGRGWFKGQDYPVRHLVRPEPWRDFLKRSAAHMPKVRAGLPSHYEYLNSLRAEPAKPKILSKYSFNYS